MTIRLIIFTFITILTSSQSFAVEAHALTLKSYLKNYFETNEIKKNIDLEQSIQKSKSNSLDNNFDGLFIIEPKRSQLKDKQLQTSWDKQDEVKASYTQNLPTGTRISIGGTKYLNNSPLNTIYYNRLVDNSFFVRLEQDLWRNGLGVSQRYNHNIAKANSKWAELNHSIALAKQCNQALELFLNAYRSQKTYNIYKDLNSSSIKTLKTTQRSYKQKLTRKIDYIAAQADQLNNEQRLLSAETAHKTSLKNLLSSMAMPNKNIVLLTKPQNPSPMQKETLLCPIYKDLYELNIQSQKQNYLSSKNLRAPDVKLYIENTIDNNQFVSTSRSENLQNFNIGLNINIPINDKSLKSKSKVNYYNWQKAVNEKAYQLRNLANTLNNLNIENKKYDKQLLLLNKQDRIYKKQTLEARKLLRSGRIEYKDYTFYRDQAFNNKLSQVELLKNKLQGLNSILLLTNPQANLCGVIN